MTVLAHKTFDAMEAPEWSGQRSKPPVEITPLLLEAPPIPPEFLHIPQSILPIEETKPGPTLVIPTQSTTPTPQPLPLKRCKKPPIETTFTDSDKAWFKDDPITMKHTIPVDELPTSKPSYLLHGLLVLTIVTITWVAIANVLFRTL